MDNILIDCSLTGGRGPAKKVYELCTDLKQDQIPFYLLTDIGFAPKLRDMGIEPDYIVDVKLSDPPQVSKSNKLFNFSWTIPFFINYYLSLVG